MTGLTLLTLASLTAGLYAIILVRYFLVAGAFWVLFPRDVDLQDQEVPNRTWARLTPSAQRDIRLSAQSAGVFAVGGALLLMAKQSGLTLLYDVPGRFGWWYIPCSYVLVLLLQDAYFYFTHRIAHLGIFYRHVHRGHHQSRRPTAWTSLAFDPAEAVLQAAFLIVVVFFIPLYSITLIAILATMTVWAVVNHLGIKRMPFSLPHEPCGRWFIGPRHHSLHHDLHAFHFGLYFTFWDRILGTEHPSHGQRSAPTASS